MKGKLVSSSTMSDITPALVDSSLAVAGEANQTKPGEVSPGRYWRITHRTLSPARGLWSSATDPRGTRNVSHRDGFLWASGWVACRVSHGSALQAKGTRRMWKPKPEGSAMPSNRLRQGRIRGATHLRSGAHRRGAAA